MYMFKNYNLSAVSLHTLGFDEWWWTGACQCTKPNDPYYVILSHFNISHTWGGFWVHVAYLTKFHTAL